MLVSATTFSKMWSHCQLEVIWFLNYFITFQVFWILSSTDKHTVCEPNEETGKALLFLAEREQLSRNSIPLQSSVLSLPNRRLCTLVTSFVFYECLYSLLLLSRIMKINIHLFSQSTHVLQAYAFFHQIIIKTIKQMVFLWFIFNKKKQRVKHLYIKYWHQSCQMVCGYSESG